MFQTDTSYLSKNGQRFLIVEVNTEIMLALRVDIVSNENHVFDTKMGDSLCENCDHGDLVKLLDTSSETYKIKSI